MGSTFNKIWECDDNENIKLFIMYINGTQMRKLFKSVIQSAQYLLWFQIKKKFLS